LNSTRDKITYIYKYTEGWNKRQIEQLAHLKIILTLTVLFPGLMVGVCLVFAPAVNLSCNLRQHECYPCWCSSFLSPHSAVLWRYEHRNPEARVCPKNRCLII